MFKVLHAAQSKIVTTFLHRVLIFVCQIYLITAIKSTAVSGNLFLKQGNHANVWYELICLKRTENVYTKQIRRWELFSTNIYNKHSMYRNFVYHEYPVLLLTNHFICQFLYYTFSNCAEIHCVPNIFYFVLCTGFHKNFPLKLLVLVPHNKPESFKNSRLPERNVPYNFHHFWSTSALFA